MFPFGGRWWHHFGKNFFISTVVIYAHFCLLLKKHLFFYIKMEGYDTVRTNLPLWKRQRQRILEKLIIKNFIIINDFDVFQLPTNIIRAHEKKNIASIKPEEREALLFDHFLIVCRRSANTPYIQCMQKENDKITWNWGNVDDTFEKQNPNICCWMKKCFNMATTLFDLQSIISHLRNDKTRGPTVATFCSLSTRYIRKKVFKELDDLAKILKAKNLLTLQRLCDDLDIRILRPLRNLTKIIDQDEIVGGELINFLFKQKNHRDNYHVKDLVEDCISLAIERYYQIIVEWITQCTLSFDLAHEFFIWDMRKQNEVTRSEFDRMNELECDEEFGNRFVCIPQLIPEDFKSVSEEIFRLGWYLYTMRRQNAGLDLLSTQYTLDTSAFKDRSLGEFSAQIITLYQQSSCNILEHFRRHYDVVKIAKQLPRLFIGLNSSWIYEFAENFVENDLLKDLDMNSDIDHSRFSHRMTILFHNIFGSTEPADGFNYRYFQLKVSKFVREDSSSDEQKSKDYIPSKGTFPDIELDIVQNHQALKLAFPAKVLQPYRKIFYHLFLLNRAKYLIHRKYFSRCENHPDFALQECATVFLFIRFLNVYHEFICGVAANAYSEFAQKLDSANNLDDLVNVQLEFVHKLMEDTKLDQENEQLKNWIAQLMGQFGLYACDKIDVITLQKEASPFVGKMKKHLLENKRSLNTLKNILFGFHFASIGAMASDEPLWKLLQHVDEIPEKQ